MNTSPDPTNPSRPILVAVDFEPAARAALITGAQLAMCAGAALKVLHVVHTPADRPNYYERPAESDIMLPVEEIAERMLTEFLNDAYRGNPALSILEVPSTILVSGLPSTRIPDVARLMDARLIVIGQERGRTGIFGRLLPSLSEQIASRCDIPVTVVYPDAFADEAAHPPQDSGGTVDTNVVLSP